MDYSRQSVSIHNSIYILMTFGTFLLNLRREQKLSQKDVAAAINVAQSTYCDWESDKRLPKTSFIRPLAQFFKLKEEVILQKINGSFSASDADMHLLRSENHQLQQRTKEQQSLIDELNKKIQRISGVQ